MDYPIDKRTNSHCRIGNLAVRYQVLSTLFFIHIWYTAPECALSGRHFEHLFRAEGRDLNAADYMYVRWLSSNSIRKKKTIKNGLLGFFFSDAYWSQSTKTSGAFVNRVQASMGCVNRLSFFVLFTINWAHRLSLMWFNEAHNIQIKYILQRFVVMQSA